MQTPENRAKRMTDMPQLPRPNVLLIDDDPSSIHLLHAALSSYAELRFAVNGQDGIDAVRTFAPDLILLDAEMPGMSGLEVCRTIKAEPAIRNIPVIFVTQRQDIDFEVEVLEAGAVDFISKPIHPALVNARVQTQLRIKELTDQLRRAANLDGLTGIANRRALDQRLPLEWRRCTRTHAPLSVLMIDVDHFKLFNDHCGHQAGDEALRKVATTLQGSVNRAADLVARYGGEEFTILSPETTHEAAMQLAERARQSIEALQLVHPASSTGPYVTISVGVSTWPATAESVEGERLQAEQLIEAADGALYQAKQAGRNRCIYRACSGGSS